MKANLQSFQSQWPCLRGLSAHRVCDPPRQIHRNAPSQIQRHRRTPLIIARSTATTTAPQQPRQFAETETADMVIIGSGIGGLCCAALLAKYGYKVIVCEAHYHAGGAAHGFQHRGYHFDAGPSFFAGMSGPPGASSNPLKQVLDAIGEQVESVTYDRWVVYSPEGTFPCVCDSEQYSNTIRDIGGEAAYRQWCALEKEMAPLGAGAALFPAAALRADPGIVLTAGRFGPALLKTAFMVKDLTGPFSRVVERIVTDPWLKNFLDLECFVLSGMLAKDTIAAEMVYMYSERNGGSSTIDYPIGGGAAIVAALVRGIEKHGGQVLLRSAVDSIIVEGGRAVGVKLKSPSRKQKPTTATTTTTKTEEEGAEETSNNSINRMSNQSPRRILANRAVISNASIWDTATLVPPTAGPGWKTLQEAAAETSRCGSFMHLHLGIDATDLPADLQIHHLIVNSWEDVEAPQNICIISIPTVIDPQLAPPGKAVVHAYTAGNEPWEVWENVLPGTPEYEQLKEERSQCLWRALERIIPDIRSRAEVALVGTPHTHARFLRRHKGTYGAAISARNGSFPGPGTDLPGLFRCGDSCAPGIGVPAAAASGMIAANTLAPVWRHLKLLDDLKL